MSITKTHHLYVTTTNHQTVFTRQIGSEGRRLVPHQLGITSSLGLEAPVNGEWNTHPSFPAVLEQKMRRMLAGALLLIHSVSGSRCPLQLDRTDLQFVRGHNGFQGLHSSFICGCKLLFSPEPFHEQMRALVEQSAKLANKNAKNEFDYKLILSLLTPKAATEVRNLQQAGKTFQFAFTTCVRATDYRFQKGESLLDDTFFQCTLGSGDVLPDYYNEYDLILENILSWRLIALANRSSNGLVDPETAFSLFLSDVKESMGRSRTYLESCKEEIDKFKTTYKQLNTLADQIVQLAQSKNEKELREPVISFYLLLGTLYGLEHQDAPQYDLNTMERFKKGRERTTRAFGDASLEKGPKCGARYWPVSIWKEGEFDQTHAPLLKAFERINKKRLGGLMSALSAIGKKGAFRFHEFWQLLAAANQTALTEDLDCTLVAEKIAAAQADWSRIAPQDLPALVEEFRNFPTYQRARDIVDLTGQIYAKSKGWLGTAAIYTFVKHLLLETTNPISEVITSSRFTLPRDVHLFGLELPKVKEPNIPHELLHASRNVGKDVEAFFVKYEERFPEAVDYMRSNYRQAIAIRKLLTTPRISRRIAVTGNLSRYAQSDCFTGFLSWLMPKANIFPSTNAPDIAVSRPNDLKTLLLSIQSIKWPEETFKKAVSLSLTSFEKIPKTVEHSPHRTLDEFHSQIHELTTKAIPIYQDVVQKEFRKDHSTRIQHELYGDKKMWRSLPPLLQSQWLLPALLNRRVNLIRSTLSPVAFGNVVSVEQKSEPFVYNPKTKTLLTVWDIPQKEGVEKDLSRVGEEKVRGHFHKLTVTRIKNTGGSK